MADPVRPVITVRIDVDHTDNVTIIGHPVIPPAHLVRRLIKGDQGYPSFDWFGVDTNGSFTLIPVHRIVWVSFKEPDPTLFDRPVTDSPTGDVL